LMLVLFVVLYSLGEAFYSPRVYEYAAAIAPTGQEASYGALSYVPFFLAKLFVGTVSGVLLARYCPETGPRHAQTMWLVIALIALIAPVGLLVLRRVIRVREAGRED
jgi:dipeptide/tripeptide permease